MSNAVGFLLVAVVVSVVGGTILAVRHRRPTSFTTTIDDFSERMSVLAPEQRPGATPPTGATSGSAGDAAPGPDAVGDDR